MTEIRNISVQSRFKALELISFSVENREETPKFTDPLKITYEFTIHSDVDEQNKVLTFKCPIKIYAEPEKVNLLGSIETRADFEVLNLDEIKSKEKELPTHVLATFIGLLISSTRGMLTILSKGTSFEKGILPIINPMVFFKQKVHQG